MAPATRAGALPKARNGHRRSWTRADIIEAIREWAELYGEPPRAADWNPSAARWTAAEWRIARYRAGRPDGTPWPSLNRAKAPFGGSLNAALIAAGFEPNRPGPRRPRATAPANRATPADEPARVAAAVRRLVAARESGDPTATARALEALAASALAWRRRL